MARLEKPMLISRDDFICHTLKLMERTRGREQPGFFNSTIVTNFFCLHQALFDPAVNDMYITISSKPSELLNPVQCLQPITYDGKYLEAARRLLSDNEKRRRCVCSGIVQEVLGHSITTSASFNGSYDLTLLVDNLAKCTELDLERSAAADALKSLRIYYKVALKHFIDDVTVKVIEEKPLAKLADILAPTVVFKMPADLVEGTAGESKDSRSLREQ
ncbi:hypothetical protein BJ170DRAFT_720595 [Xylariales sp. AK1849]|nr:hypothetical protein BJ170DRAFT_720595 [Xylariales sp. AK1849]